MCYHECMLMNLPREFDVLKKCRSPFEIQDLLDHIPMNEEQDGETCLSPLSVLHKRRAHCIEGALLASVGLILQKRKPHIVNLKVDDRDFDHVIAIFKEKTGFGALSKTNHAVLRYRDPVYRTVRELIMSYFHEYFLTQNGEKTLYGYTRPISVLRFGSTWITRTDDLWDIAEKIFDTPYIGILPPKERRILRKASDLECKSASLPEWKRGKILP